MKGLFRLFFIFPLLLLCVACSDPSTDPSVPPATDLPTVSTISLQPGVGTLSQTELVAVSDTETTLPTPTTHEAWEFVGWIEQDGDTPFLVYTPTKTSVTLRAVWRPFTAPTYTFSVANAQTTLLAYLGTETQLIVPSEYGGFPVTRLADGLFADHNTIRAVSLPNGLTETGMRLFAHCTALTEVTMPMGLTTLSAQTFAGCTALTSVTLPDSLIEIGDGAFWNCTALASATIPHKVTKLGDYVFSGCASLSTITLPDSITRIGVGFANGCAALTACSFPTNLQTIGELAFSATALQTLELPQGVMHVGNYAFSACTQLVSVHLPSSVTELGDGAFAYCDALAAWDGGDGLLYVGNEAFFGCAALTEMELAPGLQTLGQGVFSGCTALEQLTLPFVGASPRPLFSESDFGYLFGETETPLCNQVKNNNRTFYLPESLHTVTVTGNSLSAGAFQNCLTIRSVRLVGDIHTIPSRTFAGCGWLADLVLPNSLAIIESLAFENCTVLTSVRLPASLADCATDAFRGCDQLLTLYTDSYYMARIIATHPLGESVRELFLANTIVNVMTTEELDALGYRHSPEQPELLYVRYVK